jgi:pre-mRNA-processing factor 19
VASTKSGTVFEKRLVEAHLEQHGTDPVTGEQLSTADLVEIKGTYQYTLPFISSISNLL